jgi:hypothetical protein
MSVEGAEALYEAVFAHPGPGTEDEYFALPEMPTKVELMDGVLVVKPLSSVVHQRLVWQLGRILRTVALPGNGRCSPGSTYGCGRGTSATRTSSSPGAARCLGTSRPRTLCCSSRSGPGNFRQDRIVKHGDYAAAGVSFYLRVDLEKGHEVLEATLLELVDGSYREAARSTNGLLRSSLPWPFEVDLRASATGRP